MNKINGGEIIVNSVKGISFLTPNINNLPFQVNWSKNRHFQYENIHKKYNYLLIAYKSRNQVGRKHLCQTCEHYRNSLGINELERERCPILNLPENIKLSLNVSLFMYDKILCKLHFFLGFNINKPPPKY